MKFNSEIGKGLIQELAELYPELPVGKTWLKYGKNRIYFNQKEEEMDYTFYIEFDNDSPEIMDYEKEYWDPKLEPNTKEDLEIQIEKLYYNIAYPLDQPFPANTIREIRKHRRFECTIISKNKSSYTLKLLPQEIEVKLDKSDTDEMKKTSRKFQAEEIYRVSINPDSLEEVTDEFERLEDEADLLFMQNLQKSVPSKIKVAMDKTRKTGDIEIEKGENRICVNCQKEFISYDDIGAQFCSNDCKKDFQQDSW